MDTNDSGDLSELERRLSGWRPAADGLNSEAMLFAAGRAAALNRRGRYVWPALTGAMTMLAIGLGIWLGSERGERQMLAERLQKQTPNVSPVQQAPPLAIETPKEAPSPTEYSPDSVLATHRALEQGLDSWPPRALVMVDPSPNPTVLRMGSREALLDP